MQKKLHNINISNIIAMKIRSLLHSKILIVAVKGTTCIRISECDTKDLILTRLAMINTFIVKGEKKVYVSDTGQVKMAI